MNRHDLDRLIQTIDAKGFTALSSGLGLGELKPTQSGRARPAPSAPAAQSPVMRPGGYRPGLGPDPQPAMRPPTVAAPPAPPAATAVKGRRRRARSQTPEAAPPRRGSFSRRLLAYGLDFLFVASSLGVALGLATLLTAVRTGETDNVLGLAPVQWVVGAKPYVLLAVVYGAFLAYSLLFKVLAGRTCGEILLRVMPNGAARKTRQNGPGEAFGGAP